MVPILMFMIDIALVSLHHNLKYQAGQRKIAWI